MKQLRTIPFYRALSRPELVAGCEREPILFTGLMTFTLIVAGSTVLTLFIGILIWLICFQLLRKMGKADPYMSKIYIRHIKYRAYYPPRATPFAQGAVWARSSKQGKK